jgi:hypothetical protein
MFCLCFCEFVDIDLEIIKKQLMLPFKNKNQKERSLAGFQLGLEGKENLNVKKYLIHSLQNCRSPISLECIHALSFCATINDMQEILNSNKKTFFFSFSFSFGLPKSLNTWCIIFNQIYVI